MPPSPRRLAAGLGALAALAALGLALRPARRPAPVVAPAPPSPHVECGGARLQLRLGDDGAVELRDADGAGVGLRVAGARGRQGGAGRVECEGGEAVALRCEGDRFVLRWEGAERDVVLSAAEAPSLVFVPGGAPHGGEIDAPFAAVASGGRAVVLGAGRFLWRDFPARFEARGGRSLEMRAGDAATAVASAFARAGSVATLRGRMVAPAPGASVVALDEQGRMAAATLVDASGAFSLASSLPMATVYPAAGSTRVGAAVAAREGVEVPGPTAGALRVRVVDHDDGGALPARVVIHGHRSERDPAVGAREPNLGPPHRASGAGPLLDLEAGEARLLLPAGPYRVLATRGLEYSVDAQVIEVAAGDERTVELRLRREVDTPGWAGCDLHVHARGSFDALVSIDDRVRSLMGAGVDFAAASEHNRTGSYEAATLSGQSRWLTWVPAVEVTTVDPLRGHFNVIPYRLDEAPRYRRTTLGELLAFVRGKSPGSLVQVNHPRMGNIGHFNALHLDAATQRGLGQLASGFELLEVYNGFDLAETAKTEGVLLEWMAMIERGRRHWATGNSDSHSVQYVNVGYPRTYVALAQDHDGGAGAPLDVPALIEGLKAGRVVATSGPFVEVTQGARGPGEGLVVEGGQARLRVRVRAASWVDASEVEVFAGGKSALKRPIAGAEARAGRPEGSLAEGRAQAVRFDEELSVPVGEAARGVVVIVRGRRKMGEVLPFMDWAPMAIVNPMMVEAR